MPKRTPNSELTSYQSEKRLKEYKASQVQPSQGHTMVQQINANSRQQFIIEEEEGAYSQRSSSDDQKPRSRQGNPALLMQTNDGANNSGSLLNFSGKGKPQK